MRFWSLVVIQLRSLLLRSRRQRELDEELPVIRVRTMPQQVADSLGGVPHRSIHWWPCGTCSAPSRLPLKNYKSHATLSLL